MSDFRFQPWPGTIAITPLLEFCSWLVISKKGVLIMQPISVEKFADMVMKNNKGYHKKELVKTLRETLAAKKNGARCMVCGAPIWAAGSAITGSNLCFTCTTGEADDSEDYEIE